jgi:hypothetical protein
MIVSASAPVLGDLRQKLDGGHLLDTWPAGHRPEVHDDDLAALIRHLPLAASLLGKAEVGGEQRRTQVVRNAAPTVH